MSFLHFHRREGPGEEEPQPLTPHPSWEEALKWGITFFHSEYAEWSVCARRRVWRPPLPSLDALTGVPLRSDFRHTSPPVAPGEALTLDGPVVSDLPVAVDDARVTTRLE